MRCSRKILLIVAFCLFSGEARAGMPVFDYTNFGQNLLSAIQAVMQTMKQVQQYSTQLSQYQAQLKQYEDQIKNSVAPAAYIWDQAQQSMRQVLDIIDTIERYKQQAGNLESYLAQFKDVNYYRNSPCFGPNGCTEEQWAALGKSMTAGSQSQKWANDALIKGIEKQELQLKQDAENLVRIQSAAENAAGRMEAIQAANQLAGNAAGQLLQIRTLLLTQQNALAAKLQTDADREALAKAADESALAGSVQASPQMNYHTYVEGSN